MTLKQKHRLYFVYLGIFLSWLSFIVPQILHHEFFRDEVRALSYSLHSHTVAQLLTVDQPRDGHPLLWYLILRVAHDTFHTNAVLPIASVIVAAAAVAIFLVAAPFPIWMKVLFVFSAICLREYSVIARNYGISMMLMFAFAALHVRHKRTPIAAALVLFLLANTNVHSMILVPLFLLVWFTDWIKDRRRGHPVESAPVLTASFALAGVGMLVCVLTIYPNANDLAFGGSRYRPLNRAVLEAITIPGKYYPALLPAFPARFHVDQAGPAYIAATSAVLLALSVGLLCRLSSLLAALGGLWGTSLIFAYVSGGQYRHQLIWVVFVIVLYWIAMAKSLPTLSMDEPRGPSPPRHKDWRPRLFRFGLYGVVPFVLACQVETGALALYREHSQPFSMSAAAAAVLRDTPGLDRAIVMGEPDYMIEALPYYVSNPTYLPREHRFGRTVLFTRQSQLDIGLADILAQAQRLNADYNRPVVILLADPLDHPSGETIRRRSYAWTFRYTGNDVAAFLSATRKLATLRGSTTVEDYDVYLLK